MSEYFEKKENRVFLFSVISCLVVNMFSFVSRMAVEGWYGILIGILLVIIAVPFHWNGKKHSDYLYVVSILLNSVGIGFSIGAYYSYFKESISLLTMVCVSILFVVLSFGVKGIVTSGISKKMAKYLISILIVGLLSGSVYLWINNGADYFSFTCFMLIYLSFYVWVYFVVMHENQNVWRDISFGNFGAFIIITITVVAIITEGDCLDICGFGDGGKGKKLKIEE